MWMTLRGGGGGGVNLNRSRLRSILKGTVRIKMNWKDYQTVGHPKYEPRVGKGLFGIRLLILHYKFQFSKSIKSSVFRIFLNLTHSLGKISLSQNAQRSQKGRVKRCQNSLQVYPRLKSVTFLSRLSRQLCILCIPSHIFVYFIP